MAKSEPKTMRFELDVEAYINTQKGENFSDKFHNLVRRFKNEEVEKQKKIALLDKDIAEKEKRIRDLNDFLFDTRHLERQFKDLQSNLDGCKGYLEHFLKKDIEKALGNKVDIKPLEMKKVTGL